MTDSRRFGGEERDNRQMYFVLPPSSAFDPREWSRTMDSCRRVFEEHDGPLHGLAELLINECTISTRADQPLPNDSETAAAVSVIDTRDSPSGWFHRAGQAIRMIRRRSKVPARSELSHSNYPLTRNWMFAHTPAVSHNRLVLAEILTIDLAHRCLCYAPTPRDSELLELLRQTSIPDTQRLNLIALQFQILRSDEHVPSDRRSYSHVELARLHNPEARL